MAEKKVAISIADNDSVKIGDAGGTVTTTDLGGGHRGLDIAATIAGASTVQAYEGATSPNMTYLPIPVLAGDIGADYVSGSEGQIKTIKIYPTGAAGGSPAKLVTYKYSNATYPTFQTSVIETTITV
jgi:hypothetical protein